VQTLDQDLDLATVSARLEKKIHRAGRILSSSAVILPPIPYGFPLRSSTSTVEAKKKVPPMAKSSRGREGAG